MEEIITFCFSDGSRCTFTFWCVYCVTEALKRFVQSYKYEAEIFSMYWYYQNLSGFNLRTGFALAGWE